VPPVDRRVKATLMSIARLLYVAALLCEERPQNFTNNHGAAMSGIQSPAKRSLDFNIGKIFMR